MNDQQIAHHVALLKNDDTEVRMSAINELGEIGVSAVPALAKALNDMDRLVRRSAADALGNIGGASAVSVLIEALQDEFSLVRCSGAEALGKIGDASAIPALVEVLKDEVSAVRRSGAEALGKIGDADFPALIEALKHKDSNVRSSASDALGQIGATAVPALIKAQKDRDDDVRALAAEALWKIGDPVSLPRKILATLRFSAQERIDILDTLRRVRGYKFDDTRTLCHTVLNEGDATARLGAQTVLNWLDGDRELLIASMPASPTNNKNLLIAHQGETVETHPETLLVPSSEPKEGISPRPQQPSLWKRLFGKRK